MDINKIMNAIGFIWRLVFISISGLVLELFCTEELPNPGDIRMVKSIPGLVFGSAQWLQLLPLTIVGFLMYCVTFIAWLTHAVWEAPQKAVVDRGFLMRYQFAFGKVRPTCWWWALVAVWESLALVGLQMIGEKVQYKIYFLACIISIMQILVAEVGPCKYKIVDLTETGLYSAFALFLLTITAFIPPLDLESKQAQQDACSCIFDHRKHCHFCGGACSGARFPG